MATAMAGLFAGARRAGAEQLGLLRLMARRPELFVPMASIWVASFGSGLHAPVTTYYLLEVGATTSQLGDYGVIMTVGSSLLSPFYGWLLDRRSAALPVLLSAACCALGCLLRGLAPAGDAVFLYSSYVVLGLGAGNFWNVVGAYVALATPRDLRPLAVSGFQVQVSTLNVFGTSLFPAWDWVLIASGAGDKLLRYRIHMSVCSLFCIFGFFYMLLRFRPCPREGQVSSGASEREARKLDEPIRKFQLALLLATLVVQAFGETVVMVLWPLHIRKLGWDSHEYAYLQLTSQFFIIVGNMGYPALARSLGQRRTASCLPVAACLTCAAAFLQPDASPYGQGMHVLNALACLAVCGVMKVCFQHLATLAVPPALQGRIFSLVAVMGSIGKTAGNIFGTRLAEHEPAVGGQAVGGRGATPFLVASLLFLLAGLAAATLLAAPAVCLPGAGGADGAAGETGAGGEPAQGGLRSPAEAQ